MKKVKPLPEKHHAVSSHHFAYKRISHFIDVLERIEEGIYKDILKVSKAPRLDEIKKKEITFPSILFPGKNIPTEWWYFTGHLSSGKKKFGFEFCFFKLHPQALRAGFIPLSFFRKKPFLIVHLAVTDITSKTFTKYQDSGMIHHDHIDYDKLDLSLNTVKFNFNEIFRIDSEMLSLELKPMKKMVKHFHSGYKTMYKKKPHRTYYVSFPRTDAKGKIKLGKKTYEVSGEAWFDHQKCNAVHMTPVQGWDWFSIMFSDNTELMIYMLRDKKGFVNKCIGGSYIKSNSTLVDLKYSDIKIKPVSKWTSPKTKIIYPSGWAMEIPRLKIKIKVIPSVKNQEMDTILTTPVSYWEGACNVTGTKAGKKISGNSYVELVGYDKRLFPEFIRKSVQ